MSADEDTELRDLVAQTLESNGVLGKIKAELRANVFLTLEEQESVQNKTPFLNKELNAFLGTKEGRLVAALVQEFLEHFNLEFTQAVFEPESGVKSIYEGRELLAQDLNLEQTFGDSQKEPLLKDVLVRFQEEKLDDTSNVRTPRQEDEKDSYNIPEDLSDKQIQDAREKFEYYDMDRNGTIDKDELRSLFSDIFPSFHRNMLERYVNDEFRASDKDFSNSIDFDEFLSMYRRLFIQCRSVVAGDVASILTDNKGGQSGKKTPTPSPLVSLDNSTGVKWEAPVSGSHSQPKPAIDPYSSDVEEDPFFDDPVPLSNNTGLQAISQSSHRGMSGDAEDTLSYGKDELPPLPKTNPPSLPAQQSQSNDSKSKNDGPNIRPLDKRMSDMDFTGDVDIEYEDDFLSTQSLSQKSPRTISKSEAKSQNDNGSIAEEIEEEIEDISIEGEDFLKSQNSAFDDLTTDRTISQHDLGFDYAEDIQLP